METIDDVQLRLRAEFVEMPGLRLTFVQAQRLCGLEPSACHLALTSLVNAKFLRLRAGGVYARLTEDDS
jgi:hypothetical protein